VKAVFDVNASSRYAGEPGCYHFEGGGRYSRYLDVTRDALGDWVVYRETRRNGVRQAYVGVARVVRVTPDPHRPGHHYAAVEQYLPFPTPAPFTSAGRYWETPLRGVERRAIGRTLQGQSLRRLTGEDFAAIVEAGLQETLAPANAIRLELDQEDIPTPAPPAAEASAPPFAGFAETADRRIEQMLVNRKIRDANFRLQVLDAYENRCAVTGLRLVNGGGRAEVQAAHIKPVAAGGPDIVQNGLALSATVHWLFDRHLISIDSDLRLLVAHNRVPTELRTLFRPESEPIHLPRDPRLHPAEVFLAHHREASAGSAEADRSSTTQDS
jgi:putative restriction endonuclease